MCFYFFTVVFLVNSKQTKYGSLFQLPRDIHGYYSVHSDILIYLGLFFKMVGVSEVQSGDIVFTSIIVCFLNQGYRPQSLWLPSIFYSLILKGRILKQDVLLKGRFTLIIKLYLDRRTQYLRHNVIFRDKNDVIKKNSNSCQNNTGHSDGTRWTLRR